MEPAVLAHHDVVDHALSTTRTPTRSRNVIPSFMTTVSVVERCVPSVAIPTATCATVITCVAPKTEPALAIPAFVVTTLAQACATFITRRAAPIAKYVGACASTRKTLVSPLTRIRCLDNPLTSFRCSHRRVRSWPCTTHISSIPTPPQRTGAPEMPHLPDSRPCERRLCTRDK